ncbi:hypothetical protein Poli38472_014272 [Pythium oligandrum]|uniref:Uncharacterized protein n=1 Tax=Pythium oligandrum TaxID=41045 RepID=A0A8K1FHQ8_PYTOL|nr:hypothetical protein Poli38472_014272 [Pythium oligandrum]|eukprot:TMW64155.1 hypothetical protein Poli38472_014272 [Pythium oligandrum]
MRSLVSIQPRPKALKVEVSSVSEAASSAADTRRQRHRVVVKRAYHQRLNRLRDLRREESVLQTQFHTALVHIATLLRDKPTQNASSTTIRALLASYVGLLTLKCQLEEEQLELSATMERYTLFHSRVQQLVTENTSPIQYVTLPTPIDRALVTSTNKSVNPLAVTIDSVSLSTCYEVSRRTWSDIQTFMARTDHFHLGSQVFGWEHRYRFADRSERHLQYSISKTFPSISAQELSRRSWRAMTTETSYQALHTSSMTSRLRLIQRVDEHNLIFLRLLGRPNQETVFKTRCLISRFQVERGYVTIYRSMNPEYVQPAVKEDSPHTVWLEMFSWTYFEELKEENKVRFEFGGEMRHQSTDNARFWMMELLLMALRWENMVVGPRFTLT